MYNKKVCIIILLILECFILNIAMMTIGSTGDVYPYLILGRELKSRGHHVTIASFSRFSELVLHSGLCFFPFSGNVESFISSVLSPETNAMNYLPRIRKEIHLIAPILIREMEECCAECDAMICNFFGTVYYSVAEKYNIPCVQTQFFPMDYTGSTPISSVKHQNLGPALNKLSYRLGYKMIGILEHFLLYEWRKNNHLKKKRAGFSIDYLIGNNRITEIYAFSPSVFPRPPEWDPAIHMSGFWFDDTTNSWEIPQSLTRFLSAGEAPVYLGFGSMNSGNMNQLFSMFYESLKETNLRAVICNGWAGKHMNSDQRLFFCDYVPHDWLFPYCKAVIHHGGAGTTASGLRWGKPTLIIPFAGDQYFWGNQINRIGCGPKPISRKRLSPGILTAKIIDLVTNENYKNQAEHISYLLSKEQGVKTAANLIEKSIKSWIK